MATYSGSDKRLQYLFNASGNLADDYDPTNGTYAVDDFAMVDGMLKKCNTAISTPEPYDSSKWDDALITEEMGSGGGGGGTTVVANPSGVPTEYLNTIKISSAIYSVGPTAEIYSTSEKQVGVWIDGRPIYKRTFDLGSDVSVSYNSWTTLSNVIIPNLDFIVKGYGTNVGGTYTPLQTAWVVATHTIQIQTPRNNYAQNVRYFTIFYCKDNDVGGSGIWTPQGSYAHHYSESEQIVGTWIDGSTLYERTIIAQSIANGVTYVLPNTNIKIRQCEGVFRFRASGNTLSLYSREYDATYRAILNGHGVDTSGTYMDCTIGTGRTGNLDLEVTIRYTKTS